MATALDLLMSTKEDVNLLSEESDICTIDAKTRIIFVPSTIVVGGVQSDKNAERIKFSCPKIVGDNLDLSKFSVRINFENVSSVDFNVSIKDQYICDDVAVDGENVTFSWLIGRNAARYMGTVRFIVCAVKTDSDSNISVEWNTAIAEVPVLEGIEIDQPQIGQEEKDVINQLLELTKNTSAEAVQNVNSAKEQAIKDIQSVSQPDTTLTIEGGLAEAKATGEAIGSLKEDLDNVEDALDPAPYQIFDDYLYHNYYLKKNGQYTHDNNFNTTKVYPVPAHTTIFFSANVNSDDERTLNNIARDLIVFSDNNRKTIIAAYDFYNAYTNETDKTVYIQASIYGETNPTYKVKNLMIQYGTPKILPYKKYGALKSLKIEKLEEHISYDYDLMGIGDSLMAGTGGEGVSITKECASILGLESYRVFGFSGSLTKDIGFTFGAFSGYIEPNKATFKIKNADLTADIWIANNQLNGKTVIVDGKEYIVTQTAKDTFSLNGYTPQNIYVPIHTKESEYTSNVYLIWCGTNDRGYKWDYLKTIVKRIPNKKYVILGLTKYGTDTTVASEAIGMNTFGSHFFNTRLQVINNAFKVLGIEPTAEDVEKINGGLMPPSLLSDETHFNANGYKAIGILLAKHIKSLNYFN